MLTPAFARGAVLPVLTPCRHARHSAATLFAFAVCALWALFPVRPANADPVDPKLAATYKALAATVDPAAMGETIRTLSESGSRVVGYPGERAAADYVETQFDQLFGKENVRSESFTATVPVDHGASLTAGGATYTIYGMWPNLVRTSQLPAAGLTGPLIYAGDGSLSNFNGKTVQGAIVLMDFNCGADWLNAPRLGAKAVVFVEPDVTVRGEAEAKFISIPLSIPRFYIKKSDAAAVEALALGRKDPMATLHASMPWEGVTARNFIGVLPGQSRDPKVASQIIVVEAYYDGMSVVPALAPAAESAGGLAGLLQTANTFKRMGNQRTMWFVATSGHFLGLQGVREMIDRHIDDWQAPGPFAALFGGAHPQKDPIYLWAGLDLASQTQGIGIFYKGWFYDVREDTQSNFSDIARVARENNDNVAQVLGYDAKSRFSDAVNPVDGKVWRNYIPGKPAFDSEAVSMAGAYGVTFASVDDSRNLVDTPFDTPDRVNVANLARQMQTFVCIFQHFVNDPNDPDAPGADPKKVLPIVKPSPWTRMGLRNGFATIRGRVRSFDPRKSLVADDPVENSLAVYPSLNGAGDSGSKTFMGVRGYWVQMTQDRAAADGRATFEFKGVPTQTADQKSHSVGAYHVDTADGEIDEAPDMNGDFSTDSFNITGSEKQLTVEVFPCVATAIYDLVDQQALKTLSTLTIFDGANNGVPRQYGYALAIPAPGTSYVEDAAIIFARRGSEFGIDAGQNKGLALAINKLRQFKIMMGSGPGATRFLLINSTKEYPEGEGYVMGAGKDVTSDESGALYPTAYLVARDMWRLDDFRINRLRANNIINEGVIKLHDSAHDYLQRADAALAAKNYELFDADARAAWGYESRAYPDVSSTQHDVVQGVLFYLALMIPFAYFVERLFFGFADLTRRLIAVAGIFTGIFLIFSLIHPAFKIALNATIILLAFVMLALAVLVSVLVWQKFEQQMKEQARTTGGTHDVGASRGSVAAAAFALGVSNMRRRKVRTFLTCTTLVLLTFTVLAFTSVVQDLRFNRVPAPGKPAYAGILLRDPNWQALQQVAYRLLDDEFGHTRLVAPRSWFLGTQPGEQTFLTVKRADAKFDARGAVGLTPQEAQVTHLDRALEAGRWFDSADTTSIILPKKIADALRISDKDVGSATVSFSGQDYTVIGILDSDKFKQVTDLDQETLTPVDFVQMAQMQNQGKADNNAKAGFQQYLHLDPDVIFYVPYKTLVDLGGDLRSVAIGYGNDDAPDKTGVTPVLSDLQNNLMKRFDMNLYAASQGKIERFSSIAATSGEGMETVAIPILIAALIVLNTMLNSVYERIREIHTFSSIGLSPKHIGTLFMAEALVYAILGSVAGYVLGQSVSYFLSVFHLLGGLELNFSSVSAVASTMVIVVVVLLSTLYPANKAAQVATPAIQRTWQVPEPEGDTWKIRLPFAVTGNQARGVNGFLAEWFRSYEGYSVGDFITEGVYSERFASDHGEAFRVGCKTWIAPFDLGVSQLLRLETVPTDFEDVYDVNLILVRISGDVSNWKRVNRRFLNTLRKQFLIWRTLAASERERYLEDLELASPVPDPLPGTGGGGIVAPLSGAAAAPEP
jgi:hypothetical protein